MPRLFAGGSGRMRLGVLGLMLAAVGMGGFAAAEYRAIRRAQTVFVPATATVESLYLADGLGTDAGGQLAFVFTPAVRYRFYLGDTAHTGTRVHLFPEDIVGRPAAQAFRTKYAPGASVECFHDPADPGDVLLIKPTSTDDPVGRLKVAAVLFLVAAVGGLVFELSAGRTAKPTGRRPMEWGDDVDPRDPLARTRRMYREKLEGG